MGLTGRELEHQARQSTGLRRHVDKIKSNWKSMASGAVFSMGGMAAGAVVGSFIFPPIGTAIGGIVGGIAGSYVGSMVYDAIFSVANEDSIQLTRNMTKIQKSGSMATPEMTFAILASNLRGREGQRLEDALERLTGTRDFKVALERGHTDALRSMMVEHDLAIRSDTGMLPDMNRPMVTASEQYAEWINSGQMDARQLVIRKFGLPMQSVAMQPQAQGFGMAASNPQMPQVPMNGRGAGLTF